MISAAVLYAALFAAIAMPYVANLVSARKERVVHAAMIASARANGAEAARRAKTLAAIASNPRVSPDVITRLSQEKAKANAEVRKRAAQYAVAKNG